MEVSVKVLNTVITPIYSRSWARVSFSHTIRGGESFLSGSHEPLPFTVWVCEMPSSLCDSLYYYKSVGCRDIFKCLLSVTEEKSVSCLQARKIIQKMNAAFVQSRKCFRVKIFISSKSLINIHTSGISTHIQAIDTVFIFSVQVHQHQYGSSFQLWAYYRGNAIPLGSY